MAAFCACCGAEIGPKAEACSACGTPLHGMFPPELPVVLDAAEPGHFLEGAGIDQKSRPSLT
jgi:hypothetical protein